MELFVAALPDLARLVLDVLLEVTLRRHVHAVICEEWERRLVLKMRG